MKALLAALLLAALAAPACAEDFSTDAIGTTSSELLLIDVGPRGVGMGGAYTAITNDAYSMYWNPAGLAQIPRASAGFMHNRYIGDINFDYATYAQRLNDTAVIGSSFRHMDAGSIPSTDINGLGSGFFHPRAFVWELGYGQHITDLTDSERDVSLGVTGRYVHQDLVAHGDVLAGDVGMQAHYYGALWPWHFGLVVQNFGRGPKFEEKRDSLPFRGRVGAAVNPTKFILISMEGLFPANNQPHIAFGGEITMEAHRDAQAFLRAGLDTVPLWNGLEGFRGASFGMGLKTAQFTFDYAFTPLGFLGYAHRFSVTFNLPSKGSRRYRER
jgi:hypothetical protein